MKTEVIKISAELQKNLDILIALKAEVDRVGNDCQQIKVVDDSTLSVGQQNLSKANNFLTTIEEKRKAIKQPYLEAGKLIDSTAKTLTEGLETGIKHIKNEISSWEKKRLEEQRKIQEEIDRKLAEEQAKIAAEAKRKQDIRDYINTRAQPILEKCYVKCISAEECDIQLSVIAKNYKGEDFFQEFTTEAFELRDRYVGLIKAKKEQLLTANTQSDAQKKLAAQQEDLERKRIALEAEQRKLESEKEAIRVAQEKEEAERLAKEEKDRTADLAAAERTKGIRFNWSFELINITKVPTDWLTLDETKVKAYIKENKDKMKEGEVSGVRFFKNMSVVS